ncbi:MAG: cytochrome ubiquinol oxidase subunit I [Labilithrix sp.]|nr:cytochrome ubiquinol oxidase subunit I [Labilithrix sp.]MCW5818176.1 cytochrome ubiquinol oxidase subunit I [Labilithrix sp.]
MTALTAHRLHFAFTVVYHYLFPQLTMGLALVIVIFKVLALRGNPLAADAARFWARVFGLTFVMGVVTGIPLEFQIGAGWSRFAQATGGVIGQTLAMEGVFAFFLESSFLYLFLFGEKKMSPRLHLVAACLVMSGSWLSGWFIIVTNAFMQHPVGHAVRPDGVIALDSLGTYLSNPWAVVQYLHTMTGAVVTGSFVVAAAGAYYTLQKQHLEHARLFLKVGIRVAVVASIMMAMPTGDLHARLLVKHQPVTFAAMEGHFHTEDGAALALIGQPDMDKLDLDNPIMIPKVLSFMTHQRWDARIEGLTSFDRDQWPDNVPLLYYAYHSMVGLGTIFIALMTLAAGLTWKDRLLHPRARPVLWCLMMAAPLPFIANTAGWMTAELGRQPWLVYGLMRTADGYSNKVSAGNALFTLLGFMGVYALLSLLFVYVAYRIFADGPAAKAKKEAA